jgi:hypothetical protein
MAHHDTGGKNSGNNTSGNNTGGKPKSSGPGRDGRSRAGTRPPEPGSRRALRREVPSTVALLAGARDFTAMRGYSSFTFDDHEHYLRQMESLLRSLAAQGIHVAVGRFDPHDYAEYCADTGQDPDSPYARTRYTADVTAGGPTVPYTGQSLDHLVLEITYETDRQATWERATDLLAQAGDCSDCGQDLAHDAFERASQALMALLAAAGPGHHHIVCSVPAGETPLLAALHARCDEEGHLVHFAEAEALVLCTVLAAGFATGSPGGVVLRTGDGNGSGSGTDQVRGWKLRDGWLRPLTEAEVFNAYCTDTETGEPVPPEPGVEYCPGTRLPPPADN